MTEKRKSEQPEPRSIRLTESEYERFRGLGGTAWLRKLLQTMKEPTRHKTVRNTQIIQDHKAGLSDTVLAKKYSLNRATIWRIRQ